jgi:hypothetical protein
LLNQAGNITDAQQSVNEELNIPMEERLNWRPTALLKQNI